MNPDQNLNTEGRNPAPPTGQRLISIDAVRGFDMFWIIGGRELALAVVNELPGSAAQWLDHQLEHVEWEGFTAWDLIMPLFLFIVGTAMPFSFASRLAAGETKSQLYAKMLRRVVVLFILGMMVQGNLLDFDTSTLHLYANTLQAIAVGYLIAGVVMLNVGVLGQLVFTALMLVGYWIVLTRVPFGEHPAGTLLPNANVAMAVDEFVLGRFRDGTTYTWILSGMTFAASVLLGVQSGHVLRSGLSAAVKFISLTGIGVFCLAGGWAWAEWLGFPIIKHIWTSSMVLWAAGWSFLLLAAFYLLIDVLGRSRWAFPFVSIGANAITMYVAYHFVPFREIAEGLVDGLAAHMYRGGPILIELTAVLLIWLVAWHMYRQRIFVRV
jgi:predicted acyltransferase